MPEDNTMRAAFIISQSVCAMAEIQGMVAENEFRKSCGNSPAYCEDSFLQIPEKYGISHNQVLRYMQLGGR